MPTLEELTIGVVNLEKRAERVELRVRSLERMAATPCSMVGRVESRLEALEAKLKARDHVDVLHADSLKHVIDKFDTRIEALEGVNEVGMSLDELRRQDRWHATFNAVLQSMTDAWTAGDLLEEDHEVREQAHRAAVVMADRAHGPLEAKCTCGSGGHPRDCLKHPQGKELHALELSYEGLKDDVEALVKAARAVVDVGFPTHDCEHGPVIDALEAALKPFETVKP